MTAQEPDRFYYQDQRLDLVGIKGNDLTVPFDFGIETYSRSTNCWRGYVMRYKIIGKQLVLDGFWFNSKNNDLPKINGIKPNKLEKPKPESGNWMHHLFEFEYNELNKKIQFTGSIWLAKDFIDSEYVHMGFQSPTAYKTVLKFDFKEGVIVNVEDKSKAVEIAREKGACKEPQPKSMDSRDIEEWIMKRFSLDIDYFKNQSNDEK
ncbi:MAG: hypothetical protein ACFFBP_01220 [Promethearchaeota archaeon]